MQCTRYRVPARDWDPYWVDAALEIVTLDRLNTIPKVVIISTCAGHPTGAHIGFRVAPGLSWRRVRAAMAARGYRAFHSHNRLEWRTSYWVEPTVDPPSEGGAAWFRRAVDDLEAVVRGLLRRDDPAMVSSATTGRRRTEDLWTSL